MNEKYTIETFKQELQDIPKNNFDQIIFDNIDKLCREYVKQNILVDFILKSSVDYTQNNGEIKLYYKTHEKDNFTLIQFSISIPNDQSIIPA